MIKHLVAAANSMAHFAQPTGGAPTTVAPGAPQPAAQQLKPSPLAEWYRDMAAKKEVDALVKINVTLNLDQVETVLRAHPVGPKTLESIRNLFEAAFAKAGVFYDGAHPFFVRDLADLCGPRELGRGPSDHSGTNIFLSPHPPLPPAKWRTCAPRPPDASQTPPIRRRFP